LVKKQFRGDGMLSSSSSPFDQVGCVLRCAFGSPPLLLVKRVFGEANRPFHG
jgi:hypothetical protein